MRNKKLQIFPKIKKKKTLNELKSRNDIAITNVDKGGATVILVVNFSVKDESSCLQMFHKCS